MGFAPPEVASANAANNLGETIYRTVMSLRPAVVLEFGVLHGYATLAIAQALRDLGAGHLWSYDLWDAYPYTHGDRAAVSRALERAGLSDIVTLGQRDFHDWLAHPTAFDLLCLDISNDGALLTAVAEQLRGPIAGGATVIFEGGSPERDQVWWMREFGRPPMAPLASRLDFRVIDARFPSWSIMPAARTTSR